MTLPCPVYAVVYRFGTEKSFSHFNFTNTKSALSLTRMSQDI